MIMMMVTTQRYLLFSILASFLVLHSVGRTLDHSLIGLQLPAKLEIPLQQRLVGAHYDQEGRELGAAGTDGAYAGILVTLSEKGIGYVREVLLNSVLEDLTPLDLPEIKEQVEWPIGTVDVVLKNVAIVYANVSYTDVNLTDTGITVHASGVQAEVHLDWKYTYSAALIPWPISDHGSATAKVEDGKAWLRATLQEHNGTLSVDVTECETDLSSLDLDLKGGQSWLYQWFVYAFQDQVQDAIESALTTQVLAAVNRLNDFLLGLPRQLPVDNTSAVDVTLVTDPIVSSDFVSVGVKGEFININTQDEENVPLNKLPAGILCDDSESMVTVALGEDVVSSASNVYFKAGRLERLIDKLPQQSLLNTASWKFLIPQLYRKYPNEDMTLNISAASPPRVSFGKDGITTVTTADMTINVLDKDQSIPVACISLEVAIQAVADIVGTNVTAEASLLDLTLALKWSEIGTFPVKLVQVATKTVFKDVILPLVNLSLKKGFPLPVIPAVELEDATIRYEDEFMLICTDIRYTGLPQQHQERQEHPNSWATA